MNDQLAVSIDGFVALPSKIVADPSSIPRVDAHIKQPKFVSATRPVMRIPARTVNLQLPSCLVASFWMNDSSDISPVCELSVDDVVISGIVADIHQEKRSAQSRTSQLNKCRSWSSNMAIEDMHRLRQRGAHDMHV